MPWEARAVSSAGMSGMLFSFMMFWIAAETWISTLPKAPSSLAF
jgi:hypothetical protein